MIKEIIMPKNGMDMFEGVLVKWLKNEGDPVEYEEPIFMVETDKITMESESPAKGVLLKKLYEDGTTLPVFTVIGYIGDPGDKIPDNTETAIEKDEKNEKQEINKSDIIKNDAAVSSQGGKIPATPYARELAKEYNIDLGIVTPSGKHGEVRGDDVKKAVSSSTPLARAVISAEGKAVLEFTGSGTGGKILKNDVLQQPEKTKKVPEITHDSHDEVVNIPLSGMRKVIAKRMISSSNNVPAVTQCVRADVTEMLALREKINDGVEKQDKISVNDLIVAAVGKALANNERFRMTFNEDHFELHSAIDIGVAVSIDGGLIVPVVRDVNKKNISLISREIKDLAKRARNNMLSADECGNARISVTNLGMYGVYSFTPIINEPEAAIVGVCAVEDVPAVENGVLVNRKKIMLCITFDHRILNGSEVCEFANEVKFYLENPCKLLI
ncbi:MAG: 2-oxo acid dehydrogenase subunit E2 [Clostridia bacterium]|nr:2-oxo acid dehydrogenase subunit E2 [Clostridia bacterium]